MNGNVYNGCLPWFLSLSLIPKRFGWQDFIFLVCWESFFELDIFDYFTSVSKVYGLSNASGFWSYRSADEETTINHDLDAEVEVIEWWAMDSS
ncbi:LOW QUALITY PROTEIN: hypothetical protein HID58_033873, partial [Brassica napus]